MKHLTTITIFILALLGTSLSQAAINTSNFKKPNFMLNGRRFRLDFEGSGVDGTDKEIARTLDTVDAQGSTVEAKNYDFNPNLETDFIAGVKPWFLSVEKKTMVFGWDQSQSTDELKVRFGVVTSTGSARLLQYTLLQDSSNYYEVDYPGFYAPDINWGNHFWTVFSYVRAFLALLQLYVIFIRPGTTKEHRLSLMWFGSTIISIQLLFFVPYIAGNFGGAIDEIHFGMMAANRRVFGYNLSGYRMSSNYI